MSLEEFEGRHLPERVRELARRAAGLARERLGPDIRVLWYGSWMRGNATPQSDIDLAVDSRRPLDSRRMAALRDDLDGLETLYEIGVVDLGQVSPRFREEVLRTGVDL